MSTAQAEPPAGARPRAGARPPAGTRPMRADARRNHERLLAAARVALASNGTTASLEDIARRADVGIGTLYRHFPNRQALLGAVFEDAVQELLARAREQLGAPRPCTALVTWLRDIITRASEYRGLAKALMTVSYADTRTGEDASDLARCCAPIREAGTALLRRAQQAHAVRDDVSIGDLLQLTHAIALAAEETPDDPELADRLLTLTLRGLKP